MELYLYVKQQQKQTDTERHGKDHIGTTETSEALYIPNMFIVPLFLIVRT